MCFHTWGIIIREGSRTKSGAGPFVATGPDVQRCVNCGASRVCPIQFGPPRHDAPVPLNHEGGAGEPKYCEHVALYACRPTQEWVTWTEASGKGKGQQAFAEFIENNLLDIVDPPGGVVRDLKTAKEER